MLQSRADARQEFRAHDIECVFVRCEQTQSVRILDGLQGFQVGVQILHAEIAFQAFQAAPPQITHWNSDRTDAAVDERHTVDESTLAPRTPPSALELTRCV